MLLFSMASTCAIASICLPTTESFSKQNQPLEIYPTHRSSLAFSHLEHAATDCAACHREVAKSTRASERHAPTMDACTGCHTTDSAHAPLHECSSCHTGFEASPLSKEALDTDPAAWRSTSPAPMHAPAPQASLRFSHAAHADTDCASCHSFSSATASPYPSMQACVTCHTTAQAPTTCQTCHLSHDLDAFPDDSHPPKPLLPGQPPTMLEDEARSDRRTVAPASHDSQWRTGHGIVALTEREECLSCHTEPSCGSCHNTDAGKPLAHHPQNYLITHRLSARQDTQDCTSCHRQETSCRGCHDDLMASPQTFPSQRDGSFHPPSWLDASSTQSHGVMARRNINECASCHAEQDCVSCHQGISPHPPEWRTQCKQWIDRNALSCVKCHTQEALTRLCP